MKTDRKFLNIKEVVEKEMVRDSISREHEVGNQQQSRPGRALKAPPAGEWAGGSEQLSALSHKAP